MHMQIFIVHGSFMAIVTAHSFTVGGQKKVAKATYGFLLLWLVLLLVSTVVWCRYEGKIII
jgi:hypothetical protein